MHTFSSDPNFGSVRRSAQSRPVSRQRSGEYLVARTRSVRDGYEYFAAVVRNGQPQTGTSRLRSGIDPSVHPRLVLLDIQLDRGRGVLIIRRAGREGLARAVAVLNGYDHGGAALDAIRRGAGEDLGKALLAEGCLETLRDGSWFTRSSWSDSGTHAPRLRVVGALAQACTAEGLDIESFLSCAEALSYLSEEGEPVSPDNLLNEIKAALTSPDERTLGPLDRRAQTLVAALREGKLDALRRSEREWGKSLGVNPAHLGRVLRAQTGWGFRELRRVYRMKHAARLLASADEQVAQIAFSVGFDDASQFGREFRCLFGATPLEFRRISRSEQRRLFGQFEHDFRCDAPGADVKACLGLAAASAICSL